MHPSRTLFTAALVLAGASNVMAASSVDLSVVGVITPSACTPTLSGNGVVDHGKISIQDFPDLGYKVLPKAALQLEVICDAPVLMAVKSADNRPGTALPAYTGQPEELSRFGLGLTSAGKKIGWYELSTANATADDNPVGLIESPDGNTWVDAPDRSAWQPNWLRTANSNSAPFPMTKFSTEVGVATTLTNKRDLPIAEQVYIDGSATLDVVYL
ncbi:DUF1120 domain-containing protein [Pseudomonas carnis]|uniref:DUF1120 domain-containing protein n=1 Tax=Pseudomonas carnis TaxID=2487355 RepID=UPI0018D5C598|nr:DUF1120 domain-containing protein [Pseudomonas carnis]MBH3367988.1 DUF1120 domain-containing protein [Pseudomonas carnis]